MNTGVAGALDNQLDNGDIVVSVDAVQHDFDVEPVGFQKGEIPYTGLFAFPADEEMRAMAMEAAGKAAPDIRGRVRHGRRRVAARREGLARGVQRAAGPEELLELAKKEGFDLSDEQLEGVSGGDSWACWDIKGCTDVCARYNA